MRKIIFTSVLFTAISIIFLSGTTSADICLLKNGDYTLTSGAEPETETPCTTADAADGTTDGVINYTGANSYSVGDPMIFDVVFEQNTTPYKLMSFDEKWNYDGPNENNKMSSPSCSIDPSNYFDTPVSEGCTGTDDAGADVITNSSFDFGGNFTAAINFIYDTVTFTNNFADTDTYTLQFNTTDLGVKTDMLNLDSCFLVSGTGDCTGSEDLHSVMQTNIEVTAPKCYVTAPTSAPTVTCVGQVGCTAGPPATGNATVTMIYSTSGMKCIGADCSDYTGDTCSGFGIDFTNIAGSAVTGETSGTYTETVDLGTVSSASYTVTGSVSGATCLPSSNAGYPSACEAQYPSSQTSNTAACKCGDPPTVTFTNSSEFGTNGKKFLQGQDIKVQYAIDDPDADDSGTILDSISQVTFYYSNDGGTTIKTDTTACLASLTKTSTTTGTIECTIPGKISGDNFVVKDTDIYFGVIVQDDKGLSGSYPTDFSATELTTGDMVDGTNIIVGTSFSFLPGEEPYPNQFPYRASANMPLRIYFSYNESAEVTLRIYSLDGMLIRQIENSSDPIISSGDDVECSGEDCNRCNWETGCLWDGTTYEGGSKFVTNGMYIFNIFAVSTGDNFHGSTLNYTKGIVVMK